MRGLGGNVESAFKELEYRTMKVQPSLSKQVTY